MRYRQLAVPDANDLIFGRSLHPVSCGFGLTIGNGSVFPEVNFTLPPMDITEETWPQAIREYEDMAEAIIGRAVALQLPGLVVELELLPPQSRRAEWGAEITALFVEALRKAHETHGLRSAVRATVIDLRPSKHPPRMRDGEDWDATLRSFEACAAAGAHILSIESEGGKEVSDEALLSGDIAGMAFALGVLACRDMAWLWDHISAICAAHPGVVSGGDSACAFGNTAMQLAHQHMLPQVFAAVVRAMTAPRSLVAFEHGAVGPSKDCAYENVYVKAITGCPISMEGKSAACAHFSPIGNIAAAFCDLWSNESVQNVRLLSGSAPAAFTEILSYDCRLMNEALQKEQALCLRDLMVGSDCYLSPQALVLSPESTIAIAKAVVAEEDDYRRTVAAGRTAVALIREALDQQKLTLPSVEMRWLNRVDAAIEELPKTEGEIIESMTAVYGHLFDAAGYGL